MFFKKKVKKYKYNSNVVLTDLYSDSLLLT